VGLVIEIFLEYKTNIFYDYIYCGKNRHGYEYTIIGYWTLLFIVIWPIILLLVISYFVSKIIGIAMKYILFDSKLKEYLYKDIR